jgi:hypothetical protein
MLNEVVFVSDVDLHIFHFDGVAVMFATKRLAEYTARGMLLTVLSMLL